MAQFLKKGSLGRMVTAEGGASDPELAEVRLTPDEYADLWRRIRSAERETEAAKEDAERRENKAYREANRQLANYKSNVSADADRRVEAARSAREQAEKRERQALAERDEMKSALEKQKNLNNNLKRIARERANADRGLTPKKERSGYVVMYSQQHRQKYRVDYDFDEWRAENPYADKKNFVAYEILTADCWRTTLQTPYDASLPLNQVRDDIWYELMHKHLYPMGFRKVQDVDKNGEYRSWSEETDDGVEREVCGLYKWDFKANYKSGLWEMTLYHTKSLRVPEEYRPADHRKAKK